MIINLTQHPATREQREEGVVNLPERHRQPICEWLTFTEIPSLEEMEKRAFEIVEKVLFVTEAYKINNPENMPSVMLGGAPFFMPVLERVCKDHWLKVVYAFSQRVSEEIILPEGGVKKVNVFKHIGFVKV